jgi:hypothetical protein
MNACVNGILLSILFAVYVNGGYIREHFKEKKTII